MILIRQTLPTFNIVLKKNQIYINGRINNEKREKSGGALLI